jgi:hypothetical protein
MCAFSVYAKAARVSWPPSKIFGDELRIIGSFSEMHMFRESLPLPSSFPRSQGCDVCVSDLTERNSSNRRVPRLGQNQDQGHRQQGVQAGAVWRGAREHPEQDGHQGGDCVRGLMLYLSNRLAWLYNGVSEELFSNGISQQHQRPLINDFNSRALPKPFLPIYIIAVCKCDRQPNRRQKTCHAL